MRSIILREEWSSFSQRLPMVAVVGLMGEWMTIYACLQQAIKNFDQILIVGDGITPEAKKKVEEFTIDYKSQIENRFQVFDLDKVDPWPWMIHPRNDGETDVSKIPIKSWSKAGFKRFNLARAIFPNSLLFSVHSDVVLFSDSKNRLKDRLSKMENPLFDSEWFSMVSAYDFDHVAGIVDPKSTPGNLMKHPALRQRTVYDYPGDWGLMGYYASSLLSVGPDPQGPEAECFYPWSRKTQCEKKGFDINEPHAMHFEWLREKNNSKSYKKEEWRTVKLSRDAVDDVNLINRMKDIKDNCNFPVEFSLDNMVLNIQNKKSV